MNWRQVLFDITSHGYVQTQDECLFIQGYVPKLFKEMKRGFGPNWRIMKSFVNRGIFIGWKGPAEALVDLGEASGTKQGADHIPRTSWCINTSTFLHFTLIPLSHPQVPDVPDHKSNNESAGSPYSQHKSGNIITRNKDYWISTIWFNNLIQQFELNLPIFPKYVSFFHLDSDAHS